MDWIVYRDDAGAALTAPARRTVLVTGAGGRIGRHITAMLAEQFDLQLMVGEEADPAIPELRPHGEVVTARLEDPESLKPVFAGIDTVLHLAGNPHVDAEWDTLLRDNIVGVRNAMEAAREAGCRRFIFASSIHAVWAGVQEGVVRADGPVRPFTLYGVSKCFGEAFGRYVAEAGVMDVICLRLGACFSDDWIKRRSTPQSCSMWLSHRDFAQAVALCVRDTQVRFGIFNVLSNNRENRLDISETRRVLGYEPVDDAFAIYESR